VVLSRSEFIELEDLTLSQIGTAGDTGDLPAAPAANSSDVAGGHERQHILATLIATGGTRARPLATLGIERSTLDRKIRATS